jgi:hypothetical protein
MVLALFAVEEPFCAMEGASSPIRILNIVALVEMFVAWVQVARVVRVSPLFQIVQTIQIVRRVKFAWVVNASLIVRSDKSSATELAPTP